MIHDCMRNYNSIAFDIISHVLQEESIVGYQEQVCNIVLQEPMQTDHAETVYYELDGSLGIQNDFSVEVQSTCEPTQQ